jgi:hypothetical protein
VKNPEALMLKTRDQHFYTVRGGRFDCVLVRGRRRTKPICQNSILVILTDCVVQRTLRTVQTVTIVMILHVIQCGGTEY